MLTLLISWHFIVLIFFFIVDEEVHGNTMKKKYFNLTHIIDIRQFSFQNPFLYD